MKVILLCGEHDNLTLSSIFFDRWGSSTHQQVTECNSWQEGVKQAGDGLLVFVRSGCIFSDWFEFRDTIKNYPHKGIIAHLTRGKGFDDQCLVVDSSLLHLIDLNTSTFTVPTQKESEQNIHHDYTPLWRILEDNQLVVNFNQNLRGIKQFVGYNHTPEIKFTDYITLAENQLWVLNNEPIQLIDAKYILMPGSGLYWIKQAAYTNSKIKILDISNSQVSFCKHILDHWDGHDYAGFAKQFIDDNNIKHYQPQEQFVDDLPQDFHVHWQARTSSVSVHQGDIIHHMLSEDTNYDYVWCSNITNYKWGYLHHTKQEFKQFYDTIPQNKSVIS